MKIDIDITSARAVNDKLSLTVKQIGDIKDIVSRLQSSIDARILNRSNLRTRLTNAKNNIETIQNDLLFLHRTTIQNINSYEESELRTLTRTRNAPISSSK